MSELSVWKQLLIALIIVIAMGVGNWFAGMFGGIACAIGAGVLIQIVRVAARPLPPEDDPPPSESDTQSARS